MPTVDDLQNVEALRGHLLSMPPVVTSTGSFGSSAEGYTRTVGSFVADGFERAMEIVPSGFAQTSVGVVSAVTALVLHIEGGRAVDAEAPGRTLSSGLPAARAWENARFDPKGKKWYMEEDYVPGVSAVKSGGGPHALVDTDPLYVLRLYSPLQTGIAAPYRLASALLRHFAPRTPIALADGNVIRVSGNPSPYRGQLMERGAYAVTTLTIPTEIQTTTPF